MQQKYRRIHSNLVRPWNQIKKYQPKDDREHILLLKCEAMWDIIDSMRLLVEKKRGVAAFILSRSIFEYSAVTDVIARSTDPQLIIDYIDSGKLVLYESSKAKGASAAWLDPQQKEYDTIKSRMGKKKWHGGTTIEQLVNKSQHGQVLLPGESGLYKTFYKEASSLSHGDSYVYLSYATKEGWQLTFDKADRAQWGNQGLSLAYRILAATLETIQNVLGMELADKFAALIPELEEL